MSLLESLLRTAAFLAADRRNTQKNIGPRVIRGKLLSSLGVLEYPCFGIFQHGNIRAPREDSLVASRLGVGNLRPTAATIIEASDGRNE